ncbi:MAG: primosomal protein N' [Actinomycetes bacterium]
MTRSSDAGDQLELADLPPAKARRSARQARAVAPRPASSLAAEDPIARVAVDVSLPHLDRPFDYAITEAQSANARPGVRVRVRFAGQLVNGYILERLPSSEHEGRISRISSVVSPLPVLTPSVLTLCRAVADRYAGSLADVLRLAIPPRHAAVEREHLKVPLVDGAPAQSPAPSGYDWNRYRSGADFLGALRVGSSPRAAWSALPGVVDAMPTWVHELSAAVASTSSSGRGSIVVVPDHRDVELVARALVAVGLAPTVLTSELGPRQRYRRWLEILTAASGTRPTVVVGTRAAMYSPVADLGLIALWDDGDDLHAEPRAPYPHMREVAAVRASEEGCALIVGAYQRTAEVESMLQHDFLRPLVADRATVRACAPRIRASSDAASGGDPIAAAARLPTSAWRAARDALKSGPVLVQVPRRGYVPQAACVRCREQARCAACHGPLAIPHGDAGGVCQWCGRAAGDWRCPACGADQLRAQIVGAARTAEELGRAFPGTSVVTSGGREVRATVPDTPALVVATPGAEPVPPNGYAAALLLDAWALLGRSDLRATEEALRRWMTAGALVKRAPEGTVVVVADASIRAVQALVRWDPAQFAAAELSDRELVGLPPARRIAVLHGAPSDVRDLLARVQLPDGTEQLGPVPWTPPKSRSSDVGVSDASGAETRPEPLVQVVLRTSRRQGAALATALSAAQGERSVRKASGWVTVKIDPVGWG